MGNKEVKREECKMCGKKLSAQDMFRKMETENGAYYLCCQICYEQFTGKPHSGHPDIEYK